MCLLCMLFYLLHNKIDKLALEIYNPETVEFETYPTEKRRLDKIKYGSDSITSLILSYQGLVGCASNENRGIDGFAMDKS